jgi:nucleotide-binding universal stress UspA family protein
MVARAVEPQEEVLDEATSASETSGDVLETKPEPEAEKNHSKFLTGTTDKSQGFRVLIPINSQDSSLYALEAAMARQWPHNTQFMLTTVIESLSGESLEAKTIHRDALLAEQNEHRRTMNIWLNKLRDSFSMVFPDTITDMECGRIAEKICEVASTWRADYIMIGSHDFNLVDRKTLGSIASKVLLSAPCTVEAVRFSKLRKIGRPGSDNDTEEIRQLANQSPRRIIVATDFSKQADNAIQWVADNHWFDNTEIRLLNVTEASKREPGVSFLSGSKGYISEQQYQRTLENRLRVIGRQIAKKQPRCKLEVFVLQSDSVSGAILELASGWDADLVVLGAKGEGSSEEQKFGSMALPIMDSLDCSTIAIRDHKRQQVHFSWYLELQKTTNHNLRTVEKTEAKKL